MKLDCPNIVKVTMKREYTSSVLGPDVYKPAHQQQHRTAQLIALPQTLIL
jgi:hypothetical protein